MLVSAPAAPAHAVQLPGLCPGTRAGTRGQGDSVGPAQGAAVPQGLASWEEKRRLYRRSGSGE